MKHRRALSVAALGVATSMVGTFAWQGTASADTATDVQTVVNNLPDALEDLTTGLQNAIDVLASTTSAVQTSAAVGQALVDAGTTLISGTEQFGALGLGLLLVNAAGQVALAPLLNAIDNPDTASGLVNPDDVTTILGNLGAATTIAKNTVKAVGIDVLEGDLYQAGLLGLPGTGAVLGDVINGATGIFLLGGPGVPGALLNGTTFSDTGVFLAIVGTVAGAGVGGAAGSYLIQVEDSLAPVLEALAPVVGPLHDVLAGL